MASRGRGRGFGRGKSFSATDQLGTISAEKVPSTQHSSPYPPLDYFPAPLPTGKDYEEIFNIQNQILSHFQSSNYYLKMDDENIKLFSSQGETTAAKKTSLNFDWDYFPLELRPTGKRKLKNEQDILASLRKNKMVSVDLAWLDKLEEKEKVEVTGNETTAEEDATKKEAEENRDDEEVEEFDDEELDLDTDYITSYFDNGEDYLDEDNDMDEGPCY